MTSLYFSRVWRCRAQAKRLGKQRIHSQNGWEFWRRKKTVAWENYIMTQAERLATQLHLTFRLSIWSVLNRCWHASDALIKIGWRSQNNTQLQKNKNSFGLSNHSSGLSSKSILDALPLPAAWTGQDASSTPFHPCSNYFLYRFMYFHFFFFFFLPELFYRQEFIGYFSWTVELLAVSVSVWGMTSCKWPWNSDLFCSLQVSGVKNTYWVSTTVTAHLHCSACPHINVGGLSL